MNKEKFLKDLEKKLSLLSEEEKKDIINELFKGDNYFIIAAPYRVTFKQTYKYRVDLLLNIFKEIV